MSTDTWLTGGIALALHWSQDEPVTVTLSADGAEREEHGVPLVEVLTAGDGHVPASARSVHTGLGAAFRHVSAQRSSADGAARLEIVQSTGALEARAVLEVLPGTAAVRSTVEVRNTGDEPVVLLSVASWSAGFTLAGDDDPMAGWQLLSGRSDWLGEGRWSTTDLRRDLFPRLAEHLTGHDPRGSHRVASTGTWSTGQQLPFAVLEHAEQRRALAWQIEHNGSWRWEIGEDTAGGYLALSGPTADDSSWSQVLRSGEVFRTVPVTVAVGADADAAVAALTRYRRASRRDHDDNRRMPVVFNDYMNTLDGDPTTEKLLPLIASAAEVGAEVFCIDAGWYDDSGHWWDSVGEWLPSTTRFPGGLGEVIGAIRDAGMVPGLWLEPEVVGVRSPVADALPPEAFLQRHGQRVVEHHRYHLDLRHPAARAHLDGVVDRLVREFGVGFFKFDYNIDPGAGTDLHADSPGAGLLAHNRAHLDWLDGVLDRHPQLVIENCSSGAMRMDWAMLSRLAMQSTSDQQDFRRYPPIAASAPLSMLPEQAASWAYPQPDMDEEEIAFCLVTGLLGRYYVSGYLNRMDDAQRMLVTEAIAAARSLRTEIAASAPSWPLGLPGWEDGDVALALDGDGSSLVSLWHRHGEGGTVRLELPHLRGRDIDVETVFPRSLPAWPTSWDADRGVLDVHVGDRLAARTLRLTAHPNAAV